MSNLPTPAIDSPQSGAPTPGGSAPGSGGIDSAIPRAPSALYRALSWQWAVWLSSRLPYRLTVAAAQAAGSFYCRLRPARLEVARRNLLPLIEGDAAAAGALARRLFQNFALKLVDLWRYEAGLPVSGMFAEWTGWERFAAARESGRGILLLTPHLGNWEFGAPLLAERGVNLLVLTLEEPDGGLTALRQAARARWGIETLVIGSDPFAFVEVIRRLEGGAVVALLFDRPPASSAVLSELFGRKFAASVAAAELARATGCVLLPTCLPRTERGYAAQILEAVPYDRARLRSRESRLELTRQILRAFEPSLRQYADQWYHFVPVWPGEN